MSRQNDNLDCALITISNVVVSLYSIKNNIDNPDNCTIEIDISQNQKMQKIRSVLMQAESIVNDTISNIDEKIKIKKKNKNIRNSRKSFITDDSRFLKLEEYEHSDDEINDRGVSEMRSGSVVFYKK